MIYIHNSIYIIYIYSLKYRMVPIVVGLLIIEYLDDNNDSTNLNVLTSLNIPKTCYTGKQFYYLHDIKNHEFKIDKVIINENDVPFLRQLNTLEKNLLQIKKIRFEDNFNELAIDDILLDSITHLEFGYYFNREINNYPKSLTHITFGSMFNRPVDNIPNTVTHLTFGKNFNQPVDNLPDSIEYLIFDSDYFDQPVDNLPKSLKVLQFGFEFCQPIPNLPSLIEFLGLGESFNYPVDHLPEKIKEIKFGTSFNRPIDNLPISITHLAVGTRFNHKTDLKKFINLKEITIVKEQQKDLFLNKPAKCSFI